MRNSLFIMITTVGNSALGFLYWTIIARSYGKADIGLATALIAAMTLVSTISSMGVSPALIHRLPTRKPGRAWSTTLNSALALGVCAGMAAATATVLILPIVSARFAEVRDNPLFFVAFVGGVMVWTAATVLDFAFIAECASGKMLARNITFGLAKIVFVVVALVLMRPTPLGIFGSWVLGALLSCAFSAAVLIPRLGREYRLAFRGAIAELRTTARSLAGNHLITLGNVLPVFLLPILVLQQRSAVENAYFYITWMLGGIFFTISSSVGSALFAEGSHSPSSLYAEVRRAAIVIAGLLTPTMVVFLCASSALLGVFGTDYAAHGKTLLILLTIAAVPDAITNVYVGIVRVERRLLIGVAITVVIAVIGIGVTVALLPTQGIAGAGWAWLIAQTTGCLVVGVDLVVKSRRGRALQAPNVALS